MHPRPVRLTITTTCPAPSEARPPTPRRPPWPSPASRPVAPGAALGRGLPSARSIVDPPVAGRTSPPALLRVEEAAALLCIGRSTAYELIRTRQLRSVKIGGSRRVPRAAIEAYIADLEAQQAHDR